MTPVARHWAGWRKRAPDHEKIEKLVLGQPLKLRDFPPDSLRKGAGIKMHSI